MVFESRLVRAWVIVSVFSMFLYALAQLINSLIGTGYVLGFGSVMALFGLGPSVYSDRPLFLFGHFFPEIGLIVRFIGLTIALASVCLLFAFKKSWNTVKGKLAVAVFFEGLFFLGFLATGPMLLNGINVVFAVSYFIQVVLAAPVLIALSWKIRKNTEVLGRLPWTYMGLAFVGYVAAMWVNSVARWVYMGTVTDISSLFAGSAVGFLNATITMSIALGFAIIGLLVQYRSKAQLAIKLFALSLSFVGLYFLLFLIDSVLTNALNSVMLREIWATPLLGLGLSLLYVALRQKRA